MDRSFSHLHPDLLPLCLQFIKQCHDQGVDVFITETFRNEADQNHDYSKGRTIPGPIITNAVFGKSPHNCMTATGAPASKAFDFGIRLPGGKLDWDPMDDRWQKAISVGEGLGLVSGSTWHSIKDYPHFELPNWQEPSTKSTEI